MAAGTYNKFIEEFKKVKYRGFNFIEYADGGGEIYISFQAFLKFLNDYTNIQSGGEPMIPIDWESDKPFFAYSTTISCNLLKCYVKNSYIGTTDGAFVEMGGIAAFAAFTDFSESSKNIQELQAQFKKEAAPENYSIYPTIGNINYIYLNIGYISELIVKGSDNPDNLYSVRKILQDVCDGVNKALGSLNDFQVTIDVDANVITIVDFNQKRIKGLSSVDSKQPTTIKAQGLGSFITNISAQSSITPDIATTISIGAQANGNQVGVEAVSFSRLSAGIEDRIYKEKIIASDGKKDYRKIDLAAKKQTQFESNIKAYMQLVANQKEGNVGQKITFASTDKINLENLAVELYKAVLGKFTETNQTSTAFIPVKLDLTLAGISGIKIFQRFTISGDVLPYIYKDNFDFVITGVSHEINTNGKWSTKLSAIIALKEETTVIKAGAVKAELPTPKATTPTTPKE